MYKVKHHYDESSDSLEAEQYLLCPMELSGHDKELYMSAVI